MFDDYIVQPVFNVLEFIYAVLPGHDLGVAIIIFTLMIRLALWPILKKQLHQAKLIKKLQPQLKAIKKQASGDRQKEARLQMELYKEYGIKPATTILTLIIQIPIFIGLYQAVLRLINDPNTLVNFSYEPIRNLPYIQELAGDITKFSHEFIGAVDLSGAGISAKGIYLPAIILALIAGYAQYRQSKLMVSDAKDAKKLSDIMKSAASGTTVDQGDVNGAIGQMMVKVLPIITVVFSINIPSALTLYILTTTVVGYFQQKHVLDQDQEEMEEEAELPDEPKPKKSTKAKKTKAKKKKRK
ncbi:MAG: YidC/Oxa1 family membrane protein insertase [Patescibacteria group bacterium]